MSPRTFRGLSTRSTTGVVSIPLWAISARNSSRTATPGLRSKQRPDRCPPQGAHSKRGDTIQRDLTRQRTKPLVHVRKDAAGASSRKMWVESAVKARGERVHPLSESKLEVMNIGATGKTS